MAVPYKGQKYSSLRSRAVSSGQPFTDPEFPPNNTSLFRTKSGSSRDIEWKRPKELVTDPCLCVEGISSHDLVQGELGNCWLVAACACIAIHKSMWHEVIVDIKDQDWKAGVNHPGIFHFRFWRFGVWNDVVVDDLLPTRRGRLIYMRSPQKNEFWTALLEKAYAKLFGCYEALDGGDLSEALEDFTGGISETVDLIDEKKVNDETQREQFYDWLLRAADNGAVMCAAIPSKSKDDREKANDVGLVIGHAYSITAVRKVALAGTGIFGLFKRDKLAMIRLRNPWGDSEWTGPFSDRSNEWSKISKSDRNKIGLTFDNDGEFWMTFDDFCRYFINMSICHRVNTSVVSLSRRWHETLVDGEWTTPNRAGGCRNNRATFFNNPQYAFDVSEDKDDVMFQLMQKTTRARGTEKMTIGFCVMKIEDNRRYRVHSDQQTIASTVFRNSRGIYLRQTLARGRYLLVACVFEPSVVGQFLLRGYAGHNVNFRELTRDKPSKPCCCCLPCYRPARCVTRVKVLKASGIERKDKNADVNPYCVIECEGEKVKSDVLNKTKSPEFNTAAVFYRKKPASKPVIVDIYHHNAIGFDEFLGRLVYDSVDDLKPSVATMPLKSKDSSSAGKHVVCGKLVFEITVSRTLESV